MYGQLLQSVTIAPRVFITMHPDGSVSQPSSAKVFDSQKCSQRQQVLHDALQYVATPRRFSKFPLGFPNECWAGVILECDQANFEHFSASPRVTEAKSQIVILALDSVVISHPKRVVNEMMWCSIFLRRALQHSSTTAIFTAGYESAAYIGWSYFFLIFIGMVDYLIVQCAIVVLA